MFCGPFPEVHSKNVEKLKNLLNQLFCTESPKWSSTSHDGNLVFTIKPLQTVAPWKVTEAGNYICLRIYFEKKTSIL